MRRERKASKALKRLEGRLRPDSAATSLTSAFGVFPPTRPVRHIWKNALGLLSSTSSTGLEANDARLMTVSIMTSRPSGPSSRA